MFAGIDIASERHVLARLDEQGAPISKPTPFSEDREGYDTLLRLLGPPPVLVVMEATGHYWKNVFAVKWLDITSPRNSNAGRNSSSHPADENAPSFQRKPRKKRPAATQRPSMSAPQMATASALWFTHETILLD